MKRGIMVDLGLERPLRAPCQAGDWWFEAQDTRVPSETPACQRTSASLQVEWGGCRVGAYMRRFYEAF